MTTNKRLGFVGGAYLNTAIWGLLLAFLARTPMLHFAIIGLLIALVNLSIWFGWLLRELPDPKPMNLPGNKYKTDDTTGGSAEVHNIDFYKAAGGKREEDP